MRIATVVAARIVLLLVILCIAAACIVQSAHGSDCRAFFKQRVVVQQQVVAYAQPYYVQPYYAPLTYYAAGADIQSEAQAEKIARFAVPKILQQLQKQQAIKQNVQAPVPQPQQETTSSVLAQKCAKCHSGAAPKKGITIDGSTAMFCDQITRAIRMIRDDKMPKGGPPLTPDEKGQALEELLSLERLTLPPPIPQPDTEDITPRPEALLPNQNPRVRDDGNLQ